MINDTLEKSAFTIQPDELIDKDKIESAYGSSTDNWGDRSVFQGDCINLGHWGNISLDKQLTIKDRIKSSDNLYNCILEQLNPLQNEIVLEVGCGRGCGIINLSRKYQVKKVIGIDVLPVQITRTKNNIEKSSEIINNEVELLVASADATKQADENIDKIFSIKIVQHFKSMIPFAKEIKRIKKPDGKLIFAAHLSTEIDSCDGMVKEGLMVGEGIDVFLPIHQIISEFKQFGFNPRYYSIGSEVFRGFDAWLSQIGTPYTWGHDIYKAYKKGYLDYYIVVID